MEAAKYWTVILLPHLLSAITIWTNLLAGNKSPRAWLVGLGNQALWLFWIVLSGNYGFLWMNLALWVVYYRNHLKWRLSPGRNSG
jgi:hypothetical protein